MSYIKILSGAFECFSFWPWPKFERTNTKQEGKYKQTINKIKHQQQENKHKNKQTRSHQDLKEFDINFVCGELFSCVSGFILSGFLNCKEEY